MKNILGTISILSLLFCSFLFVSCDHETDEFDGPSLVDRFGAFSVLDSLEVDRAMVDFSVGQTVGFTARFNKRVDWIVRITGMTSGAVKTIEGFDSELNATNAVWSGNTTDLPFFQIEDCQIELEVPEEALIMTGLVTISGTKIYEGNVFIDFETDPGTDIVEGNFEFEFTNNTGRQNNMMAAQGDYLFFLEGTDDVVPNFFVGLVDVSAQVTGETYAPLPTTIPEELYFNAFIHSDGGPHGIAVIQFAFDTNDSGAFEDGTDETFQFAGDFPLDFTGWKHISHSMAETGMTEDQVSKIVSIRLLLISDMNSQPDPPLQVDYGIDFLTFTAGQPLQL